MFIFTAKLTKKTLIAAVVVCGLLLCGLVWLAADKSGPDDESREAASKAPVIQGIKSNDDRLTYLSSLGWKTGAKEVTAQEVRIPETFNEVETSYNEIQKQHGFDLLDYKGKRVMCYTYEIVNHDKAKEGVYAQLLIYKNRIIGGDIHCNDKQNGFIQGLAGPRECGCPAELEVCLSGCICDDCAEKTSALIESDESGSLFPDDALSFLQDALEFYDVGFIDEGLYYEDEPANNPDGLPRSPEPEVIEPR